MNAIAPLDPIVTELAQTLMKSAEPARWQSIQLLVRITPSGGTATQAFELRDSSGQVVADWYPSNAAFDHLYSLAMRHWEVTQAAGQAKWYGMAITVKPDGQSAAEFEYRDDYQAGDILHSSQVAGASPSTASALSAISQMPQASDVNPIALLDVIVTELGHLLYASAPMTDWRSVTLFAKYKPDGSAAGHDFSYRRIDGSIDDEFRPGGAQRQAISAATRAHWQMTQDLGLPRWYKMTISVEPSGKSCVDFEYKDDYKEGELLQRG